MTQTTTTKAARATGYIATDADHWATRAIYGIGATPTEAEQDARDGGATGELTVMPATEALVEHVRQHGGAPFDVSWDVTRGGVAGLQEEIHDPPD